MDSMSLTAGSDNQQVRTYSPFVGFCFIINYIVGAGFVSVPYVIWHTGIIAGVFTLIVVSFFIAIPAFWTLETMARAQALENKSLEHEQSVNCDDADFEIRTECRFELPELCRMFLGRASGILYILCILFYLFLSQWMAGPIMGTGLATIVPINIGIFRQCSEDDFGSHIHPADGCWNTYALFVLMFAVIVVPIACLELKEQAVFQVTMAIFRFVLILAISIYSLVSVVKNDISSYTSTSTVESEDSIHYAKFNGNGLLAAVPVIVFAQMLVVAIPSLSQPVSNKRRLVLLYTVVFVMTTLVYSILGVTVAIYKRNDVLEVCTANWKPLTEPEHNAALRALAYFVVLFPSLDILSSYPITVTLMANIVENMYRDDPRQMPDRIARVVHRFVWAVVPIISSVFLTNLVDLDKYSGLIAFFVVFWFPALLQYRSKQVSMALFQHAATPYSSWYSNNVVVIIVFLFGMVATLVTFVGFFLPGSLS